MLLRRGVLLPFAAQCYAMVSLGLTTLSNTSLIASQSGPASTVKGLQRWGAAVFRNVVLLLLYITLDQKIAWTWPFSMESGISTKAKCAAASKGHVWQQGQFQQKLQEFLDVSSPLLQLPKHVTNISTITTMLHLMTPEYTVVLDPLLYLRVLQRSGDGIPRLIHMTVRDKRQLAPHQVLSVLSWGRFNKGYTLLLYDDDDMAQYIQSFFPEFLTTFNLLQTSVEKSDAWRYHVLCGHGGIYADTDTICVKSFDSWAVFNSTSAAKLVVGVENMFHSQQEAQEASYVHKIQMVQWTMASTRAQPVVCRMGAAIQSVVQQEFMTGNRLEEEMGHDAAILLRTGPGVWSTQVHKYVREMGSQPEDVVEGKQVADVLVLPQTALACNFKYWDADNTESLVYHMFNNSWKTDHYKVADARRQQRLNKQRQQLLLKLYPVGIALVIFLGILAALFARSGGSPLTKTSWYSRRKRRTSSTMDNSHQHLHINIWGVSSSNSLGGSPAYRSPTRRLVVTSDDSQATCETIVCSNQPSRLQQQYKGMRRLAP